MVLIDCFLFSAPNYADANVEFTLDLTRNTRFVEVPPIEFMTDA